MRCVDTYTERFIWAAFPAWLGRDGVAHGVYIGVVNSILYVSEHGPSTLMLFGGDCIEMKGTYCTLLLYLYLRSTIHCSLSAISFDCELEFFQIRNGDAGGNYCFS